MPKLGMKPIRQEALISAAIAEIGRAGTLEVTVSQIAKRAGVSSALAHHYFGAKSQIFEAAMRHLLALFGAEARRRMAAAETARDRVEAIVEACFDETNFDPDVVCAWLNFYVEAQRSEGARRLLRLYHRRLGSNLRHGLRPLVGARADHMAAGIGALIDGVYIRQALEDRPMARRAAVDLVRNYLDMALETR